MTCKTPITGRSKAIACGPTATDGSTIREKPIVADDAPVMRDKHQRAAERTARPVGRPRRCATPEAMQAAIDRYFLTTDRPTISGLALALGFRSRQSFYNYRGHSPEFDYILKRAWLRVECHYEEMLLDPNRVRLAVFMLKRLGWRG